MYKMGTTLPKGVVEWKVLYCRYEKEYNQRHLEEFQEEKESSGLYRASTTDLAMTGEEMECWIGRAREGGQDRVNQERKTKQRDRLKPK